MELFGNVDMVGGHVEAPGKPCLHDEELVLSTIKGVKSMVTANEIHLDPGL